MTLEELGYNKEIEAYLESEKLSDFAVGRVLIEHKERYIVKTAEGEYEAEITGNLRFSATKRSDFPAVGDWVTLTIMDDHFAIIHHVLPRKSIIERQAVGKFGEKQIIASNVDVAFILQAVDNDFNLNRLERYLSICHAAQIEPVLILSKIDLIAKEERDAMVRQVLERVENLSIILLSNETKEGFDQMNSLLEKGKTYCIMGSSGVGKSSLINNLIGTDVMKTKSISDSTHKGRHTTSHRELFVMDKGILIDTPGMRELGIAGSESSIDSTFQVISDLASQCKFRDCTHTNEKGCAILNALDAGEIDAAAYENYSKMKREQQRFELSIKEKRDKDRQFGKMIKNILAQKKKTKY